MVFVVRTVNPALLALDPSTSDGQSSAAPARSPSPPRARRSPAALLGGLVGLSRRRGEGATARGRENPRPLPYRFRAPLHLNTSAPAQQPLPQAPLAFWEQAGALTPETADALRPLLDQEGSGPFVSFLKRLNGCASFEAPHRAGSVSELSDVLALAASSDAYRAFCFDLAGGADANCHDNVDVIFGNLRLAAKDPTYHGNADLESVLNYHKSCVPWSLIDDFVSEAFPFARESLEKVLALRIRLSDILPIETPAMLYAGIAGVDRVIEHKARDYIAEHRDTEARLQRNLSRSPAWCQFLAQRHPVEFVANTLLWESALQDVVEKGDESGSPEETLPHPDTASFGSRTEALAWARAMPGIGTGQAFQHLQENATVRLMENLTHRLVVDKQPPSTEAEAHAQLLNDPDWLTYLEREHPDDEAFAPGSLGPQDRHERLMLLTQQDIAGARAG